MLQLGDIHVYTKIDNNMDKLFTVKYETVKREGVTTYLNIHFTHKSECVFYDYELKNDILKLSFVHEGMIKCADILLIYL
jgi:hypothetical protein